jgi:hypothetical protein
MKNKFCSGFLLVFAVSTTAVFGQDQQRTVTPAWKFTPEVNFYFMPDDIFILPVIKVDKGKLHLEGRYNYEDEETVSIWAGYNFSGGNKFNFMLTPMVGGVYGNTDGLALGLEVNLAFKRFELYSESEYLFDAESEQSNFFYNWSDLTYSPIDNFWFGLSAQRTKLYETDLELQRGLLIGFAVKKLEVTAYVYNTGFDYTFAIFSLSLAL